MMLKKHKILVLMILLSLIGIIGVISVWLFDSYAIRREMVVADIERSLFNSVQSYYDEHQQEFSNRRRDNYHRDDHSFVNHLRKIYPTIDPKVVASVLDSVANERSSRYEKRKRERSDTREPSSIIPSFMLQNVVFNDSTISSIDSLLTKTLTVKGINITVSIKLQEMKDRPKFGARFKPEVASDGTMMTRPVLVNPSKNEFLIAQFSQPIIYILGKMAGQIVICLFIVLALIGTFLYLMLTISKQNKSAILRKSFVNNMTHELKTPVATVMAAVEAVQRYGAKYDREKMNKYLDISHKELNHLSDMIEKVLQFDVDEEKGISLQRNMTNIYDLILSTADSTKLSAKKSVEIHIDNSYSSLFLNIDEAHMRNVFLNLFDNAIKYSNESVQIQVDIHVDDYVYIEVSDNGLGIDKLYHKDIFDMFFRVPHGHLYPVKGFGLGLSYVKQVVQQHQGDIKVESDLGSGTKFKIKLPKI